MCVYISEDGGKVVELPPFIVIARRINSVQLELILERLRLTWNPGTQMFDMTSEGAGVRIVNVVPLKQKEEAPPSNEIVAYRVVSRAEVNGYLVVTVEFIREDGTVADVQNYIFTGNPFTLQGEFWYRRADGVWLGSPSFEVGSWMPGTLPAAKITPPEGRGGGDDIAQH